MANKQLTRKYIMTYVSDLFKDVNGFRPRGYNWSEFTLAELNEFWNDLEEQLDRNNIQEEKAEKQAEIRLETTIQTLIESGAKYRDIALRWILQGEHPEYAEENQYITGYEIDGFLWSRGLTRYNDYGTGLRKELLTIAQDLYKKHHQTALESTI